VPQEEVARAFADMARSLSRGATGGETLRLQLTRVVALLKATAAWVAHHDAEAGLLNVGTMRGRADERVRADKVGEGAVGRAFTEGGVVREGELVALPLTGAGGAAFGCLAVLAPRRKGDDALYEALAAQVASACEVARLRDDAQRRTKDLETAVAGLKSLEANREALLGNVSHDLKTPLTPIKAYMGMLQREKMGPLTDAQRKALVTCERNADRLLRMVNDLVLMSRLQQGKMELADRPIGLKNVAEEVVQGLLPAAELAGVRLRVPPCSEAYVRGDRERLFEACFHLVENALNHTRARDTVDVTVEVSEGMAVLVVQDTGTGMRQDELSRVFDPFARSRGARGRTVGLGLPLTARIAQLHGGRAEAESSPTGGSTFRMALPLFAGALAEVAGVDEAPRTGGILLVEDDPDSREVLQQVLAEEGYRVMAVSTASEAMSLLTNIRPAMVLLDLKLRDEDGRTVLHHIRNSEPLKDVVVYLVSGASDLGALTAGKGPDRIDGYFEKPLQLGRLLDTVASVVRPSRPTVVR
jgi:signal transduction histidine kinase/CheY-like chemotaxis protein